MMRLVFIAVAALFAFVLVMLLGTIFGANRSAVSSRLDEMNGKQNQKRGREKRGKRTKSKGPSRFAREFEKLEAELYDVGINLPVERFVAVWVALTILVPIALLGLRVDWKICGIVALVCALGPAIWLKIRRSKRRDLLEGQLVEAIGLLINALKAGHSFQAAMQSISREMEGPISDEFGRVFRETQHGMSLEESLERMTRRVESPDLEMMCSAIIIQRQVGGNLGDVLKNISGTIQSRLDLKAEIKTRTSSGRISGYIIGALPILLLVVMLFINPDYGTVFLKTDMGHMMLAVGAVLEVIGFLIINKIVAVKY